MSLLIGVYSLIDAVEGLCLKESCAFANDPFGVFRSAGNVVLEDYDVVF